MQRGHSSVSFLFLLAGASLFVWLTSRALPELVASHFVASGVANGFMPKASYVRFMILLIVGLPSLLAFVPVLGLNTPNVRINLPNRDYWLTPARRPETIKVIQGFMVRVAALLVVFLAYVHWLVVRANELVVPNMSAPGIIGGLVAFVFAMLIWMVFFVGYFRNIPL